jgi:hypothetical protein
MRRDNVNGTNLNGQFKCVKALISLYINDNDTSNISKNYPTSPRGRKSTNNNNNNNNNYGTRVSPAPQQEDKQQQQQQQRQNERKHQCRRIIYKPLVSSAPQQEERLHQQRQNKNEQKQRCRRNRDVVAAVEPTSNSTGKWSSTNRSCLTNLIEPGDLMQIQEFKKKPKLNGATIEVIVIRPSINTACTDRRWDVKVLNDNNSQSKNCKRKDRIRIISVASSNLRHFV